jgi:hypothetical protein
MSGISPGYLSNILHRRRGCSLDTARRLEVAFQKLGIAITRFDFLENDVSAHWVFEVKNAE